MAPDLDEMHESKTQRFPKLTKKFLTVPVDRRKVINNSSYHALIRPNLSSAVSIVVIECASISDLTNLCMTNSIKYWCILMGNIPKIIRSSSKKKVKDPQKPTEKEY